MTYYKREIETFRTGEIVEMTDHMKEISQMKEKYFLQDDKFLIENIGTNGIIQVQNVRNKKHFLFNHVYLQHIVPEVKTCLL